MVIKYDPRLIDVAKQFWALAPKGCITTLTETCLAGDRRNRPELVISAFPDGPHTGYECARSEKFQDDGVNVRIDWYKAKEDQANE